MSSLRIAPSLNLLVCLSLLTGSASITVEHGHARGQVPHAHGFGFCHLYGLAGSASKGGECRHYHHVVLGIEFYGGDLSTGAPLPRDATTEAHLLLGTVETAVVEAAPEPFASVESARTPAPLADLEPSASLAPGSELARRCCPPWLSVLCDTARRERSGVALI